MGNNWLWAMNRVEELKKSSGSPLFDITRLEWNPQSDLLERYTCAIYDSLIREY